MMISVGDSSAAAVASLGSVSIVPVTTRCRGVVPCEMTAAGVDRGMPWRISSSHSTGSASNPM